LNTFDIIVGPSDEYYGLDDLRREGHWNGEHWIGASKLIRHIRIHVDMHSALGTRNYNSLRVAFNLDTPLTIGQLCMILAHKQLRALGMLKKSQPQRRTDKHVEFIIHTAFIEDQRTDQPGVSEDERRLANTLESLRMFIYGLKYSGITVIVTLINKDPESLDINAPVVTWNFTPYLCLSAEEWAMVRHYVKTPQTCALTAFQEETEQRQQRNWYDRPGVERRYVPVSLVRDDPEAFRDLLWRRWRLRCALPWLADGWES
jgi:hypothetical protein